MLETHEMEAVEQAQDLLDRVRAEARESWCAKNPVFELGRLDAMLREAVLAIDNARHNVQSRAEKMGA